MCVQVRYKRKHYTTKAQKTYCKQIYLLGIVHAVNGVNVKGFTLNQGEKVHK